MTSSSRLAGIGAFVLGSIVLFAIGLFLIGERRMLFADKFTVHTEFERVSGLQAGAPVKVNGMPAGEVNAITVPSGPAGRFRVRFEVREDLHPLVRTDSIASIQTEGLVGGTFLSVSAGSEGSPPVPEQGTIKGREPFDFADLMQQMSDTVALVNETIATLRGDVEKAIREIADTAERANQLIDTVGTDVEAISASGRRIAADTQEVIAGLREGRGTAGRLLKDDELYRRATGIARETQGVIEEARRAVTEARTAMARFQSGEGPAQGIAEDLRQTLAHARAALSNLEENTEALKRNWFFRGFFKDRGYYDLDDVSPVEYRSGALEGDGRRALRVWLRADVLFESPAAAPQVAGPAAEEALTADGRARLDSAMAALLPYVTDGPLVVEGYSAAGSMDERYVRSRARATLAREHLVQRYHLDSSRTAIMPLGGEAVDSPGGDTWDGIAIALFVPDTALRRAPAAGPAPSAAGPVAPTGAPRPTLSRTPAEGSTVK